MRADQFGESSTGKLVEIEEETGRSPAFIPEALPPGFDEGSLVNSLADAAQALGRLHGIGPRVGSNRMLIEAFVRKEALESSQLEGTTANLSDLYKFEAGEEQLLEEDKKEDAREVYNYLNSLRYGMEKVREGEEISIDLICNMHNKLLSGVRGQRFEPGSIREDQNWIGPRNIKEARYVPAPPEEVSDLMGNLVEYINEGNHVHPILRIGIMHYQFEAVHPFLDGNGRLGRLLISLLLQKEGLVPEPYLYLSSFFNARKRDYADRLLAVSQAGEWEEWLGFYLEGVETQSVEAHQRADYLVDLREEYHDRYRDERSGHILTLISKLFEYPYLDVSRADSWLNASYDTANRLVNRLEEDEVLVEITGNKRNRFFLAHEIYRGINDPIDGLV